MASVAVHQAACTHAGPAAPHLHSVFANAGARRVAISIPKPGQHVLPTVYSFNTYEMLAVAMNAVREDPDVLDSEVWKSKKQLAQALVCGSRVERVRILEEVAVRTASARRERRAKRREARHGSPDSQTDGNISDTMSQTESEDENSQQSGGPSSTSSFAASPSSVISSSSSASATNTAVSSGSGVSQGGSLEERLLDNILAFVHSVWLSPGWPVMAPVLSRLVALDPHPPESINRDGSAAEMWVRQQLAATMPPGWQLQPSGVIARVQAPLERGGGEVEHKIKGVKGEVDALLVDSRGLGQGLVEVKIGGSRPYNSLYNDLRKLKRLLRLISGCDVTFEGGGTVRIPPTPTPCYLVVQDGKQRMDGADAVQQAEHQLLQLQVSMALGSQRTWQGTKLMAADPERTHLRVPSHVVKSMHRKLSKDFYQVLSSCEVYEIVRPADATW